jgi:hypothetical protein
MNFQLRKQIDEWIMDNYPDSEILIADGLEEAFVGVATQFNTSMAIFDTEKCLDILEKEGMSREEAIEYFEFNIIGAYVGEHTPAFLNKFS